MSNNEAIPKRPSTFLPYILLALVLAIVVYVRIRLLTVPLERDEGEYAYMGQLLLKGIPPYVNAYTMKLPGVSAAYALFMLLFGQTSTGIHAGLLIVNGIDIFLVYLLTKRLFDRGTALLSCASYAVLSLSQSVNGVFAHATHLVVLFSLAGFVLLLRYRDKGRTVNLFISGLCFGLAVTMKQHAILLFIFAFLNLVWYVRENPVSGRKHLLSGSALFLLGTIIPYALILVNMVLAGVYDKFWFWTVQYAREYAAGPSLLKGLMTFIFQFATKIIAQPLLWLLALAGSVSLCTSLGRRTDRVFIFGFLFFSFLSICPGLVFREHYFVLLLPSAAVLVGAAASAATQLFPSAHPTKFREFIPVLLITGAISFGLFHEKDYLFSMTPLEVSRASYGNNPFPEAPQIARYLKNHTSPNDRIAVLGSEPEIYFYADRLSATGYIYMYGLMENQPNAELMQQQLIHEIETARPKYIVVVNVAKSWLVMNYSKGYVLDWGENYIRKLYDLVGVIDIIDGITTRYLWDRNAAGYAPSSGSYLTVFKRREGA
jgi:hypothetical protein